MPFDNAVVENITLIFSKQQEVDYKVNVMKGNVKAISLFKKVPVTQFLEAHKYSFTINSNDLVEKMFNKAITLKSICNINQAIALKGDKSLSLRDNYKEGYYKLLDGRNIAKYGINWTGVYLDYSLDRIHSCKKKDIFEAQEKLLFRRVSSKLICTYDNEQYYGLNTLVVVTTKGTCKCSIKYLAALLNSKVLDYIYTNKFKSTKTVFSEIQARSVGELPIRYSELEREIVKLVDDAILMRKNDFEADISGIEMQINELVYRVYELSDEEIEIIEKG